MNGLDNHMSIRTLQDLREVISKAQKLLWRNLYLKEIMLRQKSKQIWIKEGDLNTIFFHEMMKEGGGEMVYYQYQQLRVGLRELTR